MSASTLIEEDDEHGGLVLDPSNIVVIEEVAKSLTRWQY